MQDSKWESVGSVMGRLMESLGLTEALREQKTLLYWDEAAGRKLASKVRPVRIQKGILWVHAAASTWAAELSLRRQDIMDRLNEMAGAQVVREIRLVGSAGRERR
jgi:predicted nucleic acid-binding Zn ribbon protein